MADWLVHTIKPGGKTGGRRDSAFAGSYTGLVELTVTSLTSLCNLILQDSETSLNPVRVAAHFSVETGIDAAPEIKVL